MCVWARRALRRGWLQLETKSIPGRTKENCAPECAIPNQPTDQWVPSRFQLKSLHALDPQRYRKGSGKARRFLNSQRLGGTVVNRESTASSNFYQKIGGINNCRCYWFAYFVYARPVLIDKIAQLLKRTTTVDERFQAKKSNTLEKLYKQNCIKFTWQGRPR